MLMQMLREVCSKAKLSSSQINWYLKSWISIKPSHSYGKSIKYDVVVTKQKKRKEKQNKCFVKLTTNAGPKVL